LNGVLGLVFYKHGAPDKAVPKPNSTENSEESVTGFIAALREAAFLVQTAQGYPQGFMGTSWEPRRYFAVVPLIANQRCYGEVTAK
jgi:hypothetical protein